MRFILKSYNLIQKSGYLSSKTWSEWKKLALEGDFGAPEIQEFIKSKTPLRELAGIFEPRHDKTNKVACTCTPSKDSDQPGHPLSLIRVFAMRSMVSVAKDLSYLHADSQDSDRTGRMSRLIWVSVGRTCHFVGFLVSRFNWIWTDTPPCSFANSTKVNNFCDFLLSFLHDDVLPKWVYF